jgi:uncharacterized membrane protein (DUF2068 family)
MSPESLILAMTAGAEPAMMEPYHKLEVEMKAHLNAVGLIDVVAGALFMALAVLVSVGFTLFAPWFYGAPLWRPDDAVVVIAAVALVSALFLAIGIPSLIAGMGLLKHKRWARVLAIVVAVLALASFPIGTAAGVYTLWVLTHKEAEQLLGAAN